MEPKRFKLDQENFSCPMCLELLKDPTTIPCGHSYCMDCIKARWDAEEEEEDELHSCPQCWKIFKPRPVLVKNIMLADVVDQLNAGLQDAAADQCYAGPEDVACDVCTGRRLKAFKSCLMCMASYCEKHLQPHRDVPPLSNHKLVEPSNQLQENIIKLQENVCSRHDEVMSIFCRADQQCVCYLCSVEEHEGHDTVSAAAEITERQRELEGSRLNIQQRIQDREEDLKLLHREVEAVNLSADNTVKDSEKIFADLIRLLQKRSSDVEQQVRSQQRSEVSRVKELQEKLEQEIAELKRNDAELQKLSHTEDLNQFLLHYPSLAPLSESADSSSISVRPLGYFEDVTTAVSEVRGELQDVLRDKWTNASLTGTEVDLLLFHPEPTTRAGFLEYSRNFTLDRNTVYRHLILSDGNRKVTITRKQQYCSSHPDMFTNRYQVLSRESLTGRCYWEVEWTGEEGVYVAVTNKNISTTGGFGCYDESWSLHCNKHGYILTCNRVQTPLLGPRSSRVGVYLDHRAGVLSFYSVVAQTMTLIHRVHTTFTQPPYAGLRLVYHVDGSTAEVCCLN